MYHTQLLIMLTDSVGANIPAKIDDVHAHAVHRTPVVQHALSQAVLLSLQSSHALANCCTHANALGKWQTAFSTLSYIAANNLYLPLPCWCSSTAHFAVVQHIILCSDNAMKVEHHPMVPVKTPLNEH
jgi:hypothetical protein